MISSRTYGIEFPFKESEKGTYLKMTETSESEIRSNLLHLLLTRKGSRYFMPNFGTRLHEYIFEDQDPQTFSAIESDIRSTVERFIPQLKITEISVLAADDEINSLDDEVSRHTAKIRVNYINTSGTFQNSNFIIVNV